MAINNKGEQELPDDFDMDFLDDKSALFEEEEDDFEDETGTESEENDGEGDAETPLETEGSDEKAASGVSEASDESDEPSTEGETTDQQGEEQPEAKSDDREEYSKNVQKRINREVRKRGDLERKNEELQRRLDAIEGKMEVNDTSNQAAILSNRIRNATAIKNKYLEDGEYAKASQVDSDIMDMKIMQRDLAKRKQQAEDFVANPDDYRDPTQEQSQPEIPQIQKDWITGNRRFQTDPGYQAYVNETYDTLLDEGYDPEHKSLYQELDRRIGRVQAKPDTSQGQVKKRPEAAPPPNAGKQTTEKKNSNKLTGQDISQMKQWGLDPSDPKVRKEWLRNRSASAA